MQLLGLRLQRHCNAILPVSAHVCEYSPTTKKIISQLLYSLLQLMKNIKYFYDVMWIVDITTHNLPLPYRWGVSHHMQGREETTGGESGSVCASMLLPSCFIDAEFLAGYCVWVVCWYSPQLHCLSIDDLTCMNRHIMLIVHDWSLLIS